MSDHPLGRAFRKGEIEVAKAIMPDGEVRADWRNVGEYYDFNFEDES